jgi:DNA-directed RNA polymerase sigma subunit (sigma70/sigma32)
MRERGMTFQAIGDALGVTRQRARDYVVGMEVIKRRGYLGKNPLAEKAYEAEKEAMP